MGGNILTNLGVSALVVMLCLLLLWAISLKKRDASLVDIFWGMGFAIVAAVCLVLAEVRTPYIWLLTALPIIWGIRLSIYLAARNLPKGEDPRYIAMQKRAEKKGLSEMAWRKRALYTIFFGQGILILIVSAPIWFAGTTAVTIFSEDCGGMGWSIHAFIDILAIVGALVWLIGFLFEAVGDWQLSRFMKAHKNYAGAYEDKPVLDTGLWKYTRHPNYFGNACMWWGIWLIACQAPWGWVTVFSPIIMTLLLLKVSGRDLLERQLKKRPAYVDYVKRTSSFVPWFPRR